MRMKFCVLCNEGFVSRAMTRWQAKMYRKELIRLGNYNVSVEHITSEKVTRMVNGGWMA